MTIAPIGSRGLRITWMKRSRAGAAKPTSSSRRSGIGAQLAGSGAGATLADHQGLAVSSLPLVVDGERVRLEPTGGDAALHRLSPGALGHDRQQFLTGETGGEMIEGVHLVGDQGVGVGVDHGSDQ
jgi:hypothetical protein